MQSLSERRTEFSGKTVSWNFWRKDTSHSSESVMLCYLQEKPSHSESAPFYLAHFPSITHFGPHVSVSGSGLFRPYNPDFFKIENDTIYIITQQKSTQITILWHFNGKH